MPPTYSDQDTAFQLAANLRHVRESLGLNRAGLAKASGMAPADIYRLETANTVFRADDLHRLSAAMEIAPSRLFAGVTRRLSPIAGVAGSPETQTLLGLFKGIASRKVRNRLVLITRLAQARR